MNYRLRLLIAISIILVLVASPLYENARAAVTRAEDPSGPGQAGVGAHFQNHDDDGTVKPPPDKFKACKRGNYSLGGVSVVRIKSLAPNYCVRASLHGRNHAPAQIPEGAGKILAEVTKLQFLYRNRRIDRLPDQDGHVEICYAVPPGKQVRLYFRQPSGGNPAWRPLDTRVVNGVACARARLSGFYALIGK
jgi:hypothetical protein